MRFYSSIEVKFYFVKRTSTEERWWFESQQLGVYTTALPPVLLQDWDSVLTADNSIVF